MTVFPSLKDELRPRDKLKKASSAKLSDATVTNSRQLARKWGVAKAAPEPEPEPEPTAPAARVVSIRGYIPEYLDYDLTVKAAQQRVTKTFLIMDALAKAGYRIDPIDMNQDRRRYKR